MIRVAIVDDHHAVRAGLTSLLESDPSVVTVGDAERLEEVAPLLYRTRPDVVLLDWQLGDADGLALCRRITAEVPSPGVVLYTAFADGALTVPALIAGAHAVVDKAAPAHQLFEAIRLAARGERAIPDPAAPLRRAAARRVDPDDVPIVAMLLASTPRGDIARTMRCSVTALERRIGRLLDAMTAAEEGHGGR